LIKCISKAPIEWKDTLNRTPFFLMMFALEWKSSASSKTEELGYRNYERSLMLSTPNMVSSLSNDGRPLFGNTNTKVRTGS